MDGASFRSRTEFTALQVRHIAVNAYEANLEPSPGIKPESLPYQRRALSLSYEGWSLTTDLNGPRRVTSAVCRHLHL